MARTHTLLIPHHPGFGKSPRVEWINNARDMAGFYAQVLQEQGLTPINVIGFSLGGWIAAEMAANNAQQFRRLVLVGATGIRPSEGEIKDMFVVTARAYLDASVADMEKTPEFAKLYGGEQTPEQYEAWEDARAETARIAWQPYMFYPSLAPLLAGAKDLPTLIVWGRDDAVVPLSTGQAYNKAIAGSELVVFDGCGHRPEIERADDFVDRVRRFLA
jgi:pimeloyl-ACP methyl ester carboxylesterase